MDGLDEYILKKSLKTAMLGFVIYFIWSFFCILFGQDVNGVGLIYDIINGITGVIYMCSIIIAAFVSKKAIIGMLVLVVIGSALMTGLAMMGIIGLIVGMLLLLLLGSRPWLIFFFI